MSLWGPYPLKVSQIDCDSPRVGWSNFPEGNMCIAHSRYTLTLRSIPPTMIYAPLAILLNEDAHFIGRRHFLSVSGKEG